MLRLLCIAALPLALAACGGPAEPTWAKESAVRAATYQHGGPPSVTLYTMTSSKNGSGMHSALLINASERVMFDPAGTFRFQFTPERNDVHHGFTPRALAVYEDYYARETIDVNKQEIVLTPVQAERLLRAAKSYGAVPKAQCTLAISRVLREAGIDAPATYFPKAMMKAWARKPGVRTSMLSDDDADQNHGVLIRATEDFQTN